MKLLKFVLALLLTLQVSCGLFGYDLSGMWTWSVSGPSAVGVSTSGASIQFQQIDNQIVGYAYNNGVIEGNVTGIVEGSQITLQIRTVGSLAIGYTGTVSADGNSIQLKSSDGATTVTMFRNG